MSVLPQRKLGRTGLSVSCIGLGTAELGYVYGIGPRDMPDEAEALELLDRAVQLGITFIDTARFYGEAEERIGKSGILENESVIVSTKCGHVLDRGENISETDLVRELETEVDESLRKLRVEQIPLLQVHGGTVERIENGSIIGAMEKIKAKGKACFIGISTRGEDVPLAAIASGFFDTLQLAHSILDQRMASRVFVEAQKDNIGIINRSVLLKGALTPASEYLAPELAALKSASDAAAEIAREVGTDLPSLAIRFALSNPAVDTVLVGSNKIRHIESAVRAAKDGPLSEDTIEKLRALAIEDPQQVDPKYWPAEMVSDSKGGKKI